MSALLYCALQLQQRSPLASSLLFVAAGFLESDVKGLAMSPLVCGTFHFEQSFLLFLSIVYFAAGFRETDVEELGLVGFDI